MRTPSSTPPIPPAPPRPPIDGAAPELSNRLAPCGAALEAAPYPACVASLPPVLLPAVRAFPDPPDVCPDCPADRRLSADPLELDDRPDPGAIWPESLSSVPDDPPPAPKISLSARAICRASPYFTLYT